MFLTRVYKEWRLLFWGILLITSAQFFFMARGIENIPFFLYHMYSKDHQPMDSIGIFMVKTPLGYFDHKQLSNREEEMLMNSVSYYVNLKQSGKKDNETIKKRFYKIMPASWYNYLLVHLTNDSIAISSFPQWWGNYLRSISDIRKTTVSVVRSDIFSTMPYKKSTTDSVIFTIKLN